MCFRLLIKVVFSTNNDTFLTKALKIPQSSNLLPDGLLDLVNLLSIYTFVTS